MQAAAEHALRNLRCDKNKTTKYKPALAGTPAVANSATPSSLVGAYAFEGRFSPCLLQGCDRDANLHKSNNTTSRHHDTPLHTHTYAHIHVLAKTCHQSEMYTLAVCICQAHHIYFLTTSERKKASLDQPAIKHCSEHAAKPAVLQMDNMLTNYNSMYSLTVKAIEQH